MSLLKLPALRVMIASRGLVISCSNTVALTCSASSQLSGKWWGTETQQHHNFSQVSLFVVEASSTGDMISQQEM